MLVGLVLMIAFIGPDFVANAQSDSLAYKPDSSLAFVTIHSILIEGNRKTKPQIVLREITFLTDDTLTLPDLTSEIEESRNNLMNIGLFNEVVINIKNWVGDAIDINVIVRERWYTFPVPSLDLYDRNLNVWWVEHNHDLKWLQFGLRYYQQNVRGRDEDLKLALLFGYSQLYQVQYNIPYINARQDLGLKFNTSYSRSKNITYGFANNKDLIYQDVDEFQKRNLLIQTDIIYKPAFYNRYVFTLSYNDNKISDTAALLNPDYFLNGQTYQRYFTAQATIIRDYRDIAAYPLNGSYFEITLSKLGIGLFDNVNLISGSARYDHYIPFGKNWFVSSQNKVKLSFPTKQPYNLDRGLGYSKDYVSGYEYYVIDGQSYGYTKLDLKNRLLNVKLKTSENNPFLKGARIPITLYARMFINAGYVKDDLYFENNPLNNTLLLGGGLGFDLSLIYDTTFRFDYAINKLGEHGFYFHVNSFF